MEGRNWKEYNEQLVGRREFMEMEDMKDGGIRWAAVKRIFGETTKPKI